MGQKGAVFPLRATLPEIPRAKCLILIKLNFQLDLLLWLPL
jgi:hypothetical protein